MPDLAQIAAELRKLADQLDPQKTEIPEALTLLKQLNVREPHLSRLAQRCTADEIVAWWAYLITSDMPRQHQVGYMIKRLYAGDTPPTPQEELTRRYAPTNFVGD